MEGDRFIVQFRGRVDIPGRLTGQKRVCSGIIAVVPDQIGIAVFFSPLDNRGNSVRVVKVCEENSQQFGLHLFDSARGCCNFLNTLVNAP